MKIGDKVYCIKTRIEYDVDTNTKNNAYKITEIKDDNITIETDYKTLFICYKIKHIHILHNFNEYFITEKQLRKLKIEKILK